MLTSFSALPPSSGGLSPPAVHSLNPPSSNVSGVRKLELSNRLIIGIAAAVHSGGSPVSIKELHIIKTTVASFLPTARPAYTYRSGPPWMQKSAHTCCDSLEAVCVPYHGLYLSYRFYLAFDDVDPVFNQTSSRGAFQDIFQTMVAAEDATRWHPTSYAHGIVDPSALLVSLHWVSVCQTAMVVFI